MDSSASEASLSGDDEGNVFSGLGANSRRPVLGGGGRRKRRPAGDDAVLGVFADSDGSDGGGGKRRGKGGKGGRGGGRRQERAEAEDDAPRPRLGVSFVRGATQTQEAKPLPKATKDPKVPRRERSRSRDRDSDSSVDSRFRLDAPAPQPGSSSEIGPKLPARNAMSENQMASNYGKGFSMLKKMGFTGGGLGKKEDGIANPIEVIARKKRQGLQEEGEKVGQDLYGTERLGGRVSVEELLAPKQGGSKAPKASEGWKKDGKAKRPRTEYKTAAQVAGDVGHMRIRDMRGPEERVVSSFSELAASVGGDSVRSLKELRHNARKLVAKYEDSVRAAAQKKRYFQDLLLAAAREKENLAAVSSLSEQDLDLCRELASKIETLRLRQDEASVDLHSLGVEAGKLQRGYSKAFRALNVSSTLLSLAVPVARAELEKWRPLVKPQVCSEALAPWQLLEDGLGAKATVVLCDHVVLPRIRAALVAWSPHDVDPCVSLLEHIHRKLPREAFDAVVVQVLLPRLSAEVDAWDPRVDTVLVHLWLHPWLPLLGSRLQVLWPTIRFKLSSCLERWNPRDHSAHGMLKPWKSVFAPADWEPLVEKALARLQASLEAIDVRPDGQELGSMQDLAIWVDVLPLDGLARVLELGLFPQWHSALQRWLLHPSCDFGEVMQWYQTWRQVLPEALQEHPGVQKEFAKGLEFMRHRMAGGAGHDAGDAAEPASSSPSPARATAGTAASRVGPAQPKVVEEEDIGLSLLDELSFIAGEKGLIFRPKPQMTHLGRPVYQFGNANVIVDRGDVHAAPRGGEWRRVSADEVLALAQAPERGGSRK